MTVVGNDHASVMNFFGFTRCPDEVVKFDLEGRVPAITGSPGHHASSILIIDVWSGLLLSRDVVHPGRLHVGDMAGFTDSLDRMLRLAAFGRARHVMGAYVKMSHRAGRDYCAGATDQPDELPLQKGLKQFRAIRDDAFRFVGSPGVHVFDDFAIFNGPSRLADVRQRVRRVLGSLCRS
jgi:hydroxyacylglutathione hydrolase